ncbi:hypothetical protein [Sphingorhabdus sp. M41]
MAEVCRRHNIVTSMLFRWQVRLAAQHRQQQSSWAVC